MPCECVSPGGVNSDTDEPGPTGDDNQTFENGRAQEVISSYSWEWFTSHTTHVSGEGQTGSSESTTSSSSIDAVGGGITRQEAMAATNILEGSSGRLMKCSL
ncbi:MAG: hypothetical protein LBT64_00145, partial [Puniceicoccales bacterium]|nr:hypothetical protein [Puniceicoccales bacterium]